MESRSPMILSETFIVDEIHKSSFLKKVMFWPTHFHMFHLYSYKIALYIQSSTSDLTTSNSDIKKSWLDLKHPMHLLFYLVSPTSSQFENTGELLSSFLPEKIFSVMTIK